MFSVEDVMSSSRPLTRPAIKIFPSVIYYDSRKSNVESKKQLLTTERKERSSAMASSNAHMCVNVRDMPLEKSSRWPFWCPYGNVDIFCI